VRVGLQDEEPVATADERGIAEVGLSPKHFGTIAADTTSIADAGEPRED